jgi:hypothetical protein
VPGASHVGLRELLHHLLLTLVAARSAGAAAAENPAQRHTNSDPALVLIPSFD